MRPPVLDTDALAWRLEALGAWLATWRGVWASRPFVEATVGWEAEEPALAAWLRARGPEELEAFEVDPAAHPDAPALLGRWSREGAALSALPALGPGVQVRHPPKGLPGRKWSQIQSFVGPLLQQEPRLAPSWSAVDWCAGKGHLARVVALATGREVHAVERQATLCGQGEALAARAGAAVRFHVADVLAEPPPEAVTAGRMVMALHACGDLSTRALELAVARGCAGVAVSPCCFHRVRAPRYSPLSRAGRAVGLDLDRDLLRLPTSEEVVAGGRMRRLRRREMWLRLVVDRLQRDTTGIERYRSMRSVPETWVNGPTADFVARLSAREGLGLAVDAASLARAEAWADERLRLARALGMARAPFRRPLETWLALDRAAYLAEQGWQVRVGSFCDRALTPRNLLILGSAC